MQKDGLLTKKPREVEQHGEEPPQPSVRMALSEKIRFHIFSWE
jgi:hypothetical protein